MLQKKGKNKTNKYGKITKTDLCKEKKSYFPVWCDKIRKKLSTRNSARALFTKRSASDAARFY